MMSARQYDEDPSPIGGAPMAAPAPGPAVPAGHAGFLLRFDSLSQPGRRLDFPCDRNGRVDLDALGEATRSNYLFARAVVGRGFSAPVVVPDPAPRRT